nr:MAG TPA: hypothetical protein [Caudoviricetes sp.]
MIFLLIHVIIAAQTTYNAFRWVCKPILVCDCF